MSVTPDACGEFSVYLDDNRSPDKGAFLFQNPIHVIVAGRSDDIPGALAEIRQYLADGYYLAGWISYETGLFLEGKLSRLAEKSYDVPFISFGVYEKHQTLTARDSEAYWAEKAASGTYNVDNMRLNVSRGEYETAFARIQEYLTAGDVYQVNYTMKSLFDVTGSPESYFAALRKAQQVEYGAYITSYDLSVLSLSPELFFTKEGHKVTTRPMKGTCARGRTLAEDQQNRDYMRGDDKNRAENLMIVDLLRNDLARIARPGSVNLTALYQVEKYRTLFQMTSSIEAEVSADMDMVRMIQALFPCGSVTGAPKIRAMEIIAELEKSPRGIYTGAIGYMTPNGDSCFNVPIRTITIDKHGRGEMGIGSAIVADSMASAEYEECLLKAAFATRKFQDFDLIESLLWSENEGYALLDLHMARLKSSAEYFDFSCDERAIRRDLACHVDYLDSRYPWKIRLLLSPSGQFSITAVALETATGGMVTLARKNSDSGNAMLFHKTTDRDFYDQELAFHKREYGSYDVIFVNEKGDLTEGAHHNIFLKRDGVLYTPPVEAGLLNGTLRQSLMADPALQIVKKSLTPDDLRHADTIYMGNSVRGLVAVTFRAL